MKLIGVLVVLTYLLLGQQVLAGCDAACKAYVATQLDPLKKVIAV